MPNLPTGLCENIVHSAYAIYTRFCSAANNKPDYFTKNNIGAHISMIYPEEYEEVKGENLDQLHYFKVLGLFTAELDSKRYYVLGIEAPTLLNLRKSYGLSSKLCIKGYWVDLHMAIGVQPL